MSIWSSTFPHLNSTQSSTLQSLVSGDGNVPTTMPSERVTLNASGCACGSPCQIDRIKCTAGSSVVLTVYDNPSADANTVLYTGTLSAGQEASISPPLQAINGVRGKFASGAFDFYISQGA